MQGLEISFNPLPLKNKQDLGNSIPIKPKLILTLE